MLHCFATILLASRAFSEHGITGSFCEASILHEHGRIAKLPNLLVRLIHKAQEPGKVNTTKHFGQIQTNSKLSVLVLSFKAYAAGIGLLQVFDVMCNDQVLLVQLTCELVGQQVSRCILLITLALKKRSIPEQLFVWPLLLFRRSFFRVSGIRACSISI